MVSVPIIGVENNCLADAFFVLDGGSTIRKLFPPHAAYWFDWGALVLLLYLLVLLLVFDLLARRISHSEYFYCES